MNIPAKDVRTPADVAVAPGIAIVGATGTGKSVLADALSVHFDGEIISADSMQVYRGMDIGTAKTPPAERSVPYHCIDLVDPGFPFTAALYQRHARAAIDKLSARGKRPILCGGTGLYLRAALDDFKLDEVKPAEDKGDTDVRKRLEAQAEELGAEAFHAALGERDPHSAALIHPHNLRRVIRAFEFLAQGTSYAEQHRGFSNFESVYPTRFVGIAVERELLYEVIEARVDAMMAAGLLDEVRGLLAAGFRDAATAQQAIGYKELVGVLEGTRTLEDAVAEIKQSSRRYAKRQITWFKRDPRIRWLDATKAHRALLADDLSKQGFTDRLLTAALLLVK